MQPPTFADIEAAAGRLRAPGCPARVTPLLSSPLADAELGGRLLVKAECLQVTGSFKFRGAYNRLSQLDAPARARGVVAYSSGNHAQGVACAAQILAMPAVIVMPSDAPAAKIAATKAYGAEVFLYERATGDREGIGQRLAAERDAVIVPPFDDPHVIAGQGTAGLELLEQAAALRVSLDEVVTCASGGGLAAGIALALAARAPALPLTVVEPEGFDDLARSLAAGTRLRNAPLVGAPLLDALLSPTPGVLPFEILRAAPVRGCTVSDGEALAAMAFAFRHFKLVLEPSGAAALAAVLSGKRPLAGRTVAVIASGGNVDPATFARALQP